MSSSQGSADLSHFVELALAGRSSGADDTALCAYELAATALEFADGLAGDERALIGAGEFVRAAANCPVAMRSLFES